MEEVEQKQEKCIPGTRSQFDFSIHVRKWNINKTFHFRYIQLPPSSDSRDKNKYFLSRMILDLTRLPTDIISIIMNDYHYTSTRFIQLSCPRLFTRSLHLCNIDYDNFDSSIEKKKKIKTKNKNEDEKKDEDKKENEICIYTQEFTEGKTFPTKYLQISNDVILAVTSELVLGSQFVFDYENAVLHYFQWYDYFSHVCCSFILKNDKYNNKSDQVELTISQITGSKDYSLISWSTKKIFIVENKIYLFLTGFSEGVLFVLRSQFQSESESQLHSQSLSQPQSLLQSQISKWTPIWKNIDNSSILFETNSPDMILAVSYFTGKCEVFNLKTLQCMPNISKLLDIPNYIIDPNSGTKYYRDTMHGFYLPFEMFVPDQNRIYIQVKYSGQSSPTTLFVQLPLNNENSCWTEWKGKKSFDGNEIPLSDNLNFNANSKKRKQS